MWRDERVEVVPTWAQDDDSGAGYREVDRQLRRIAKKKGRLKVEEAKWLREAERLRVWRKLGFSTALEYLEDVFGYAPRTAMERLRVAKALGELPGLEAKVKSGALPWSAARELTRVMTPQTEAAWLERARGKNLRDIEVLVAGHKKGDGPDAPKDPELMTCTLLLKLVPRVDALWQQMRRMFEDERGEHIDDVDLLEAVCIRALSLSSGTDASSESTAVPDGDAAPTSGRVARTKGKAPKPMHRIVTHRCDECLRGWREGRGRLVEIPAADIELATCDAEVVAAVRAAELVNEDGAMPRTSNDAVPRTIDGKVRTTRRPPPTLTIPTATRDFVWQRDHACCRVPGCRATRNLAVHHVVYQSQGGDHDPANLVLICDGHHKLLHDGLLTITGRAPDELTFTRGGKRLVDARSASELDAASALRERTPREQTPRAGMSRDRTPATDGPGTATGHRRFDEVVKIEQVKQALMQLQLKARAARAAAEAACAHVGVGADIGTLVKVALDLERRRRDRSDGLHAPEGRHDGQHVPERRDIEQHVADAKQALVQLGYPAAVAVAAVQAARAHVGDEAELVTLIKEALRRCAST